MASLITLTLPAPILIGFMTVPGLAVHALARATFLQIAEQQKYKFVSGFAAAITSVAIGFVFVQNALLVAAVAAVTFAAIMGYELYQVHNPDYVTTADLANLAKTAELRDLVTQDQLATALQGCATQEKIDQIMTLVEGIPQQLQGMIENIQVSDVKDYTPQLNALQKAFSQMQQIVCRWGMGSHLRSHLEALQESINLTATEEAMRGIQTELVRLEQLFTVIPESGGSEEFLSEVATLQERLKGTNAAMARRTVELTGVIEGVQNTVAKDLQILSGQVQALVNQLAELKGMVSMQHQTPVPQYAPPMPSWDISMMSSQMPFDPRSTSCPPGRRESVYSRASSVGSDTPVQFAPAQRPVSAMGLQEQTPIGFASPDNPLDTTITALEPSTPMAQPPQTPQTAIRPVAMSLVRHESRRIEASRVDGSLLDAFKANNPLPGDKPRRPQGVNKELQQLVFYDGVGADSAEVYMAAIDERPEELLNAKVVKLPAVDLSTDPRLRYRSILQDATLQEKKYTAVSWPIVAAMGNQLEFMQWLEQKGAQNLDSVVGDRHAAHFAICYGSADVFEWMLQTRELNAYGKGGSLIPLIFDAASHSGSCLQILLAYPTMQKEVATSVNRLVFSSQILETGHEHWIPANTKLNALHAAILREDEEHVRALMKVEGVDLNKLTEVSNSRKNGSSVTPFHLLLLKIGERQYETDHWMVDVATQAKARLEAKQIITQGIWFAGQGRSLLKQELSWKSLLQKCPHSVETHLKQAPHKM